MNVMSYSMVMRWIKHFTYDRVNVMNDGRDGCP